MRCCKCRVNCDSSLKKAASSWIFSDLDPAKMPHTAVIAFPGVEAVRRFAGGALALAAFDGGHDGGRHSGGDLVLHREDVAEVAVVALGPEVPAGCRLDQLCG